MGPTFFKCFLFIKLLLQSMPSEVTSQVLEVSSLPGGASVRRSRSTTDDMNRCVGLAIYLQLLCISNTSINRCEITQLYAISSPHVPFSSFVRISLRSVVLGQALQVTFGAFILFYFTCANDLTIGYVICHDIMQ